MSELARLVGDPAPSPAGRVSFPVRLVYDPEAGVALLQQGHYVSSTGEGYREIPGRDKHRDREGDAVSQDEAVKPFGGVCDGVTGDYRRETGLSKTALGRRLGVSARTIARWESGSWPTPAWVAHAIYGLRAMDHEPLDEDYVDDLERELVAWRELGRRTTLDVMALLEDGALF